MATNALSDNQCRLVFLINSLQSHQESEDVVQLFDRQLFGNIVGHVKGVGDNTSLAEWTNSQFDPTLNWADVKWIRKIWKGPLILKGILDVFRFFKSY